LPQFSDNLGSNLTVTASPSPVVIASPSTEGRGNLVGQIPNDKAQMSKQPVPIVVLAEIASALSCLAKTEGGVPRKGRKRGDPHKDRKGRNPAKTEGEVHRMHMEEGVVASPSLCEGRGNLIIHHTSRAILYFYY